MAKTVSAQHKEMKKVSLTIWLLILLTSCSVNHGCENRFDFISCNNSIPILDLDISKHSDSIRKEINELYEFDLCQECSRIEFKIPFVVEGKSGYLEVMADFDFPVCENCPVPMRSRHYFSVLINQNNQILAEGEVTEIDKLRSKILNYLAAVGNNEMTPETFGQVNFRIHWDQDSDVGVLNSVLTILYKSHLDFVERQLLRNETDFCSIEQTEIAQLKEQYPLRIEFNLTKTERLKPMPVTKRNTNGTL